MNGNNMSIGGVDPYKVDVQALNRALRKYIRQKLESQELEIARLRGLCRRQRMHLNCASFGEHC
jgi:hypothetical protein